jgi:glycerol-3-phosphate dehydrogenase (NAD(P)+)
MKFGIIGAGSWATALVKILTDNKIPVNWWVRKEDIAEHLAKRHHNPTHLSSVYFDTTLLNLSVDINATIAASDCVVIGVPSAYLLDVLGTVHPTAFEGKKIISAVKGILPGINILLNEYLKKQFSVPSTSYFTVMGPCHAEEVASEKLSYLTFSGNKEEEVAELAKYFRTYYINTATNNDLTGVQYAAVLKNIYALGSGIAHGLEYGDNFLSVLISNAADEMAGFLQKVGIRNIEVGMHEGENPISHKKVANYATSVYLGDLLVTCYSLHSRNRTFGNMIGKGYSVISAQLEMNMVAEGYNACKCIYYINKEVGAEMPIAETVYKILWEQLPARKGFRFIEEKLL